MEVDWLREGKQEDDWTRAMMPALRLAAWESGCIYKKRLAAEHP